MTVVVATAHGQVRGVDLGGAVAFRGIPYAQPPVGALRHRPPQPVQGWIGVRSATEFPARAMQFAMPMPEVGPRPAAVDDPQRISEDCLYVNVCAPEGPGGPRPVLVWIHGGGYVTGSGPDGIGDGENFARNHGVVVVTFNSRLGAFGFLGDTNCGVLDQIAALRWVRDNIASFGGDPGRVTVAGASAGAKSVATLMAVPAAHGLFQRAISLSGGGDHVSTREAARTVAERLPLHRIDTMPARELLGEQVEISPPFYGLWVWRPTIDGSLLTDVPARLIAAGAAARVPLLASTAAKEADAFLALDAKAADPAPQVLTDAFGSSVAQSILDAYGGDLGAVMTDERYGIPTLRMVDGHSGYAPTWRYQFTGRAPWLPAGMTAGHVTDLAFTWATGGGDLGELSRALHGAWGSFVRDGKVDWAPYDTRHRPTMLMGEVRELVEDPDADRRRAWGDLSWPASTWFQV